MSGTVARLNFKFTHRSHGVDFDACANVPDRRGYDFHRADRHTSCLRHIRLSLRSDIRLRANLRETAHANRRGQMKPYCYSWGAYSGESEESE